MNNVKAFLVLSFMSMTGPALTQGPEATLIVRTKDETLRKLYLKEMESFRYLGDNPHLSPFLRLATCFIDPEDYDFEHQVNGPSKTKTVY